MTTQTKQQRREFLQGFLQGAVASGLACLSCQRSAHGAATSANSPIDIGSRRELFVDDVLVAELRGNAQQRLHHPAPREIALQHDQPWEGTGSGYHSVFQDDDLYRMYYKAWHLDFSSGNLDTGA